MRATRLGLAFAMVIAVSAMSSCRGCQGDDDDVDYDNEPPWEDHGGPVAVISSAALEVIPPVTSSSSDWAAGTRQNTTGNFQAYANGVMGPPTILQTTCPRGCSVVSIIQVFHALKKSDRSRVNPSEALANPPGPAQPADGDAKNGWVVDRGSGIAGGPTRHGPGYQPGTATPPVPARLDRSVGAGEFKPGYRIVFDACALCTRKKTDWLYGQWLGCVRWYYDTDTRMSEIGSQYHPPFPEFEDALDQWSDNHGDNWRPQ